MKALLTIALCCAWLAVMGHPIESIIKTDINWLMPLLEQAQRAAGGR